MSFIEAVVRLTINLFNFATCFVGGNLAKLVILVVRVRFSTTVANNRRREPYSLQAISSFPLRFYESQGMFNLAQICQNPKQKFESQLSVINPCSVL